MIVTFTLVGGRKVGVNPHQVKAVEPISDDRSRIVLGGGLDYVVETPFAAAVEKLDF